MNLISKIRTVEERDKLESELDLLLANLYEHQGQGLDSALRTQVRSWVSQEIRSGIPDASSIEVTESFLKAIKEKLTKLKIFKLKIAFEPTDSSIDKFYDYLSKNVANNLILNFEIDPTIFGGAEITYEGVYKDLSLKRLFESEYKKHEGELLKIINK